jgi:cell division protein FtsL
MNTAARAASRTINLSGLNFSFLTIQSVWMVVIILALLASALGIVYVKDVNRRLIIQEQNIRNQTVLANERWSKLLLEQSTLSSQSRISHLANHYGMRIPTHRVVNVVMDKKSIDG